MKRFRGIIQFFCYIFANINHPGGIFRRFNNGFDNRQMSRQCHAPMMLFLWFFTLVFNPDLLALGLHRFFNFSRFGLKFDAQLVDVLIGNKTFAFRTKNHTPQLF
jgi:hypothetical protein